MKLISPSALLIVIIAFALPFCDLRCNDLSVARLNGYDFIIGKELPSVSDLKNPLMPGKKETNEDKKELTSRERIKPNPYAITALLCAIAGIVVFLLLRNKSGQLAILGLSLVGLACLLLFKVTAEKHLEHKMVSGLGGDLGTLSLYLEFLGGYYLAIAGFGVSLIAAGFVLRNNQNGNSNNAPFAA
ncbi:MAG: hypothetical protein U0T75_00765 [Chitinophagales bacterium]